MTTTAVQLAPLRTFDRVLFHLRYLKRYCAEVVEHTDGARTRLNVLFSKESLNLGQTGYREEDIGPNGDFPRLISATTRQRADEWLEQFHGKALSTIYSAMGQLSGTHGQQPPQARSPAYLAWAWRQRGNADGQNFGFSQASLLGVVQCHHLLLRQIAARILAPRDKRLAQIRRRTSAILEDLTATLRQERLETGDKLSHLVALLGLKSLLDGLQEPVGGSRAGIWSEFTRHPADGKHLLGLIRDNELIAQAFPDLGEGIERETPPTRPAVRLGQRVEDMLLKLQDFSSRFVEGPLRDLRGGQATRLSEPLAVPSEPLVFGEAAKEELECFAALDSPLLEAAEGAAFRDALYEGLISCEQKLFNATLHPRPAFYNSFLSWARSHFVLIRGVHLPFSELCLHTMVYCHNLLVLNAAGEEDTRAAAIKHLEYPRKQLSDLTPTPGDMFAIYLAVEGLRHAWSELGDSWETILNGLDSTVREYVLELAAKSPMVRLLIQDFQTRFDRDSVAWNALDGFLDDSSGEILRDFVAGRLVGEVRQDKSIDQMDNRLSRLLADCLNTETLGGALLVAEFFLVLFRHVFVPCERHASVAADRRISDRQYHGLAGNEKNAALALGQFYRWFFVFNQPVPNTVFHLLAELLKLKADLEVRPNLRDDERLGLLRQHWRSISSLTSRGLRDRPWQVQGQRALRVFWLNCCLMLFRECSVCPVGPDTGDRLWDSPAVLGCRMAAQLRRALAIHDRRVKLQQQRRQAGLAGDLGGALKSEVEDFKVIRQLLDLAVKEPEFRKALIVRGLLVKDSKDRLAWHAARLNDF